MRNSEITSRHGATVVDFEENDGHSFSFRPVAVLEPGSLCKQLYLTMGAKFFNSCAAFAAHTFNLGVQLTL